MALRRMLGWSEGDLMRSDAKPCSRLMRQTAGIFSVGGALAFWVLCKLHYGLFDSFPCLVHGFIALSMTFCNSLLCTLKIFVCISRS